MTASSDRTRPAPAVIPTPGGTGRVLGFTLVVAAVDVVLITAVATLGAFLYNMAAALLGGIEEEIEDGVMFKNDFVIFDEAHTVEHVASRHIGLSVSNAMMRYTLHRLYNPRTEKGLLAILRQGKAVPLVADALKESDGFFAQLEEACDELNQSRETEASQRPGVPRGTGGGDQDACRGLVHCQRECRRN